MLTRTDWSARLDPTLVHCNIMRVQNSEAWLTTLHGVSVVFACCLSRVLAVPVPACWLWIRCVFLPSGSYRWQRPFAEESPCILPERVNSIYWSREFLVTPQSKLVKKITSVQLEGFWCVWKEGECEKRVESLAIVSVLLVLCKGIQSIEQQIYTYFCIYIYIYIYMYAWCVCVCVWGGVHIHIHIHKYTYVHT